MELNKDLIEELLRKEIKEQVEKFMKSKRFENIVRDEIQKEILHMQSLGEIAYEIYTNDKELQKNIAKDISRDIYNSIVYALKYKDEEQDDYDY